MTFKLYLSRIFCKIGLATLLLTGQSWGSAEAFLFKKNIPPEQRYLVAVMPFENQTGDIVLDPLSREASQWMLNHLYNTKAFRLVEMDRIGDVLGQKLNDPYGDRQAYLQAVKNLGTEMILMGTIHRLQYHEMRRGQKSVTVTVGVRLVNLANGEIVFMGNVEGVSTNQASLQTAANTYEVVDPMVLSAVREAVRDLARSVSKNARFKGGY